MKKYLLYFIAFLIALNCVSQNLVPNPSFENYVNCPMDYGDSDYIAEWEDLWGSSDYYNSCSSSIITSVPNNGFGYQYAYDGNGYVGLFTTWAGEGGGWSWPPYREYLCCQLPEALKIGQKYFMSMRFSVADSRYLFSNNIGMLFTVNPYGTTSFLPNNSHMNYSSISTDTMNWTLLSGSFIADSAYNYVNIGNFYDDNHTLYTGSGSNAYFYIDMICVSLDSLDCVCNPTNIEYKNITKKITFYPNPANNIIRIEADNIEKIEIINITGQLVKKCDKHSLINKELDIRNLSKGIYLIKVTYELYSLTEKLIKK